MKSQRPIINSNHDCDVLTDRSQWELKIRAVTFWKGRKLSLWSRPPVTLFRGLLEEEEEVTNMEAAETPAWK